MQTRRKFLRNAAALTPAAWMASRNLWAEGRIPLGVQLYTVRKQAEQDLPRVLDQIDHIGYTEVEAFSGVYAGHSAASLRQMIQGAGLRVPSGHFDYNKFDSQFNYAKELGVNWMVISVIPPSLWGSLDGFRTAAKQFNAWGARAKEMDMRFAFHNHDYEFRPHSGKTGYDVLIAETDPELVFFEVDCYWAAQAGHNPVALMKRLGHRVKLLHLKDRKAGFPNSFEMNSDSAHFVPVGSGSIDWKAVIAEGQRLGVEHYFVEQDQTAGPPIDALRMSYRYLRSIT